MQLPANVQAILRNKWALAGVGVAAGAGVITLARRKDGDAQASSTAEDNAAVGAGSVQFPDSGMTDLATALGDIDSRYAEQVGIFRKQLATDHAALLAMQKQLQKKPAPAKPPPKPTPRKPPPKPPTKPTPHKPAVQAVTVRSGNTLSGIAKANKLSLSTLRRLNPHLFDRRHRGGNLIHPGEKVRVR